ncbi:MAG: peptidase M19 [Chloroflexaceae bacterium]|nr:peptidase M19 [Chloroflexaceae bacterium]NJO05432.1 peptidase M19 [Chloroflexaceae bacterium]
MIIDAHEDIAYNALSGKRDFSRTAAETRAAEQSIAQPYGLCTMSLPDLLAGGTGLVFATIFTLPAATTLDVPGLVYHAVAEAHQQGVQQLNYYRTLAERDDVRIITSRAELAAHHAAWQAYEAGTTAHTPGLGLLILMENAEPIRTPNEAAWWQAQGVRIIGPAWQATRYCGGTRQPGPLTVLGRDLLQTMEQVGLILDTSHFAEESFWQALDLFGGTVIASHSNCRRFVSEAIADRHLSDEMIKALIARDAVIGMVLYDLFLVDSYQKGQPKASIGLDAVLRHIDHICQIAGSTRHIGIGSDFDGGFGSESIPRELDTAADLPRIAEALLAHGYSQSDVDGMMGGNWLRVLERGLPEQ